MAESFFHVIFVAVDHDDKAAEGNVLNVVDGTVKNTDVQVILPDEVGNDRFIGHIAPEFQADNGLVAFCFFLFGNVKGTACQPFIVGGGSY